MDYLPANIPDAHDPQKVPFDMLWPGQDWVNWNIFTDEIHDPRTGNDSRKHNDPLQFEGWTYVFLDPCQVHVFNPVIGGLWQAGDRLWVHAHQGTWHVQL